MKKYLYIFLVAFINLLIISGCSEKISSDAEVPEKLISGLKDLDGKKAASLSGSCFYEKAVAVAPDVKITPVYFNDNTSSVQALLEGRVDAVFMEKPIVDFWCTSYPDKLYNAGIYADDIYSFALKKGSPLREKISRIIQELEKSGELAEFKKKWCSSLSPERKIRKWEHKKDYDGSAGILHFGTDPSQEPMAFMLNGQYAGVDIEVINRVAYELNMKLVISSMKFSELIPALQQNKIDLAGSAMSVTEAREKLVDFVYPYCRGFYTILAKRQVDKDKSANPRISGLEDLADKKVASISGSTFEAKATAVAPDIKIRHIYFSDNRSSINALLEGKVDAVLLDEPVSRLWCTKFPEKLYLAGVYANDTYSFAVRKNSPLKNRIDPIIRILKKSGELDNFAKKWCENTGDDRQLERWNHKKDYDGSAGILRYATNLSLEPMAFMLNGKHAGMDIEVINRVAYELNMKLEVIDIPFDSLICALTADRADIIGGTFSITPERQKKVDFVIPYYIGGYTILAAKDQ